MQRITYTQGNTFSVSVPMMKKMVKKVENVTTITTEDYIPEDGDIIEVRLIGERRQYRYTPTIEGNVAVFVCTGNELAGRYGIEVNVLCANGERMRFADPHAIELVPYTGIMDNFVVGSVELGASVFFAMRGEKGEKGDPGATGRGIADIKKTASQGLIDTYTITYTDGTTSTYQVTNGAKGDPAEQLIVYMTESGGTYSLDQEVFDIEDALSNDDSLECYLVWDGNNPAVVRLRCYGYNVEETIGGHSQSCIVWSGLDNIGNRHIVKAYHDSTNDVDVVNYSVASPDGKGITSVVKTATVGLVDTYTITYSDGTTSTYTVTNGRDGQDGKDGADGVSLGEVAIADNLTTDDAKKVLSAKQGKILGQAMNLVVNILKSGVYTVDKSAEIEELEDMFNNYVDVTKSLTNVSVSPDVSTAAKGTNLTLTFTPSASYVIDAVTVTMGGVSQAVTIAQDQKSATCTISSVSSDIDIVASASYVEQDLIDSATKLTGSGVIFNQRGNFGNNSSYDCFIVPLEFGKWYRLSGYDWAAKGGTSGAFNLALVKSDGNGGFENIKTTELTASIFTKNNSIWDTTNTNNNIYMQTASSNNSSTYMFATPTSSELSGVNDIYLAVNIKFSSVDISDDVSLFAYKPKDTYSVAEIVKYYGLVYSAYDLGRNANLYYDCVVIKATKGATYSYSGDNWSAQSSNGQGFAIGLAKGVGNLFDNLKATDFASGASWLSSDNYFNHTANIFKASVADSGSFTIPTDADLSSSVDLYIVINTRFNTVDVSSNLTLTKQ